MTQRDHVVVAKEAWQKSLTALHHLEAHMLTGDEAFYLYEVVLQDSAATIDPKLKQAKLQLAEKLKGMSQ